MKFCLKGGTEDFKTLLNNFNDEEFSIDSFFKYKFKKKLKE